jgi:serine/threonine-protein kinase
LTTYEAERGSAILLDSIDSWTLTAKDKCSLPYRQLPGDIRRVDALPRLDGIRLLEHLSTENVTEIYAGIQEPLGRPAIVKLLRPNVLPTSPFALALEREARLLSELSHPYVQRLYEFRRNETRMWLVLERIEGHPLDQVLRRFNRISLPAAASIGVMVSAALRHCHERGIVHRDIQPKHIILAPGGRLVLTHFVGALKERLPTAPELLDGSERPSIVPYMSPEQILGETTDGRTDLFSLGCVLYEAITGQSPFDGPDDRSVAQRIRHGTPPQPSRQVAGIPNAAERIILRCLEKLPSDRYYNAAELNSALERLLRQVGDDSPERCLNAELGRLGLFLGTASGTIAQGREPPPSQNGSAKRAVLGLLVFAALIVAGGLAAQRGEARAGFASRGSGKLQLRPDRAGYLRLVVDPWATVTIDGQLFDTTPFARSIPLTAGAHYIHLEHPQAPIEQRTVAIAIGETVLLDVRMKLAEGALMDAAPPTVASSSSADESP